MYGGLEPQCSGSYPRIFGSSSHITLYVAFSPRRWRLGDNPGYVPHPTGGWPCSTQPYVYRLQIAHHHKAGDEQ